MSYKQDLLTGIFHYPSKELVSLDINPHPQYHFYPLEHQDTYHTHQEFHLHHDHKLEHPEDKLNKSLTGQFSHFSKAEDFYILRNKLNFFSFLNHHHIPLKARILFVHFNRARNIFAHLADKFYKSLIDRLSHFSRLLDNFYYLLGRFYMFHQGLLSHFSTFFRRLEHPEDRFYKFLLDLLFRFNKVFGKQGYPEDNFHRFHLVLLSRFSTFFRRLEHLEDNFHRFHLVLLSRFHKLKYTLRHPEDSLNNSLQDQFSHLNMHFFIHKHLKLHLR